MMKYHFSGACDHPAKISVAQENKNKTARFGRTEWDVIVGVGRREPATGYEFPAWGQGQAGPFCPLSVCVRVCVQQGVPPKIRVSSEIRHLDLPQSG